MHHLIVTHSITQIKHLLKSTNPLILLHSSSCDQLLSSASCLQLDRHGEPLIMQFMFVYADKLPLASSGKRRLKNIPPPRGGRQISRQYKTPDEITVPYTLTFMVLDIIQNYGTSVRHVTICNLAVDYIPSLNSFNVIACPVKGIPEAGACQLSLSCHCLPSANTDHAFGVSKNDFIPKPPSKTRSNCTRMKHILLDCSGSRVGVLVNKELRCIARMETVTHWEARRLHFPLNICNVIKSRGVRRKMENACTNLVCSHYQGKPICSLRKVLQLLIRENSYHVHLEQRFPFFLRRGALFRREIRHGALSSPLYQRHVCAYLAVFSELYFTSC